MTPVHFLTDYSVSSKDTDKVGLLQNEIAQIPKQLTAITVSYKKIKLFGHCYTM